MNALIPLKFFIRITVLLVSLEPVPSFGQTVHPGKITSSFIPDQGNHLLEKVFVHTDRSCYLCGEIMWFKAYVENATGHQPLSVSKVLYVEVLNKLRQPVLQGKIAVQHGSGSGSFDLPASLASGTYEVRAYTNWMKNESPDHYFRKFITIVNTTDNPDSSILFPAARTFAEFFPEGGSLVSGLPSEVGFKINNSSGKGLEGIGVLLDPAGDTVTHFQTFRYGMGHFSFLPRDEKPYSAIITLKDGSVIRAKLPPASRAGCVMHLTDDGDQLKISVACLGSSWHNLYLIAETNRRTDTSEIQKTNDDLAVFIIRKESLQEGVARITLFNEGGQPVCERLYFKRPQSRLIIDANPDKPVFHLRDKVTIELSATDEKGNASESNLSASVYRLDSLHATVDQSIFTYLWLSSDLKGTIEDPGYYFSRDPAAGEALENLLLTQGWRTFDTSQISRNIASSFTAVPENDGHIITGRITSEATGKPAANVLVYLSVPSKRVQLHGCISDAEGLVHFDMKDFYGASQVVLQTNTSRDSMYHLEIFTPFSEEFSGTVFPAPVLSEASRNDLESAALHMQIAAAYHQKDLQKWQPLSIDTLPFYQKPFKTYLLDNYTRFTTMEEVMREYVQEVNVTRKDKKYHFKTFNSAGFELDNLQPSEKIFDQDPLILLDGVPVFDVDKILAYDPLKVQKLEIVTSKYNWGPVISEGILSYTTYGGNLPGYTLDPQDLILDYDGLQKKRIFYSPQYTTEKELKSRLPDFRDLLYWSDKVSTNEKGRGQLSFYTGDIPGRYVLVVQGISASGKAGRGAMILDVEK